jgi:hypothetical protein
VVEQTDIAPAARLAGAQTSRPTTPIVRSSCARCASKAGRFTLAGRNLTGSNSDSYVTKRTDVWVYSDLRCSRFITLECLQIEPGQKPGFSFFE